MYVGSLFAKTILNELLYKFDTQNSLLFIYVYIYSYMAYIILYEENMRICLCALAAGWISIISKLLHELLHLRTQSERGNRAAETLLLKSAFLRADAKHHVNKLQEKGEEPIKQEQIIASNRQEVAAKWSRFIFWVGGLSQQAGKQSQLPSIPRGRHKQRSAVDVGDNKSRCRECQTIGLRNMQQKRQKESQMRRRIKLSGKQGEEEVQVQKYLCLQTR